MADPAATLTQNVVVGYRLQADEKTAEAIVANDCRHSLVGETPIPSQEYGQFERALTGQDLAREPGRLTTKKLTLPLTEEILGFDATTPPPFDAALQSCGTQRVAIKAIPIGAVTGGPFRPGETVTSGAKSAVFIDKQTHSAQDYLVFAPLTGGDFVDTDVIAGADSMASATASGAAVASGFLYHPLSESTGVVPPSVTAVQYRGGKAFKIIGARGDATFTFAEGNPGTIQFTHSGPQLLTVAGGLPAEDPPANIPVLAAVAPLAVGGALVIDPGASQYAPPIVSSFELAIGNQVGDRTTITTGGIPGTGLAPPRIRQVETTLVFATEDVADATHNFVQRATSGDDFAISLLYGDWEAAGGRVAVHAYSVQYDAPQYGDNQGVLGVTMNCKVRRGPRVDWSWYMAVFYAPTP